MSPTPWRIRASTISRAGRIELMAGQVEIQQGVPLYTGPSRVQLGLRGAARFIRRQPLGAVSVLIIAVLVVVAIFAGHLHTVDPKAFGNDILQKPNGTHWFGTNRNGQDLWSQVLYGARPSLLIGVATVGFGVIGGTILGLLAGYLGGWLDTL